jgi:hypothetical protein
MMVPLHLLRALLAAATRILLHAWWRDAKLVAQLGAFLRRDAFWSRSFAKREALHSRAVARVMRRSPRGGDFIPAIGGQRQSGASHRLEQNNMATRAQRFRAEQQSAARPAKAKSPSRARRDVPIDTAQPGVSATDRKVGAGRSGTRNVSARAGRKGGASLEDSATGRPSRKSTRKSTGVKRTSNLRQREVRRATSAKARATRNRAAAKK